MGHKLKRDSKIKWSSMVDSIKSLLDIKPVLQEFLKYSILDFNKEEWTLLEELHGILMPVKDVVNIICTDDADLIDAEVAFQELFNVLEANDSTLAKNLLKSLKAELKKRWNPKIAGLLKYLNDPKELEKAAAKKKRPSAGTQIHF